MKIGLPAFLLLCVLCPVPAAHAVEVDPPRLELTIPPGEPTQGKLTVTNHSSEGTLVRIQASEYRALEPGLRLPSAQTWFSFRPDSFRLDSGASASVTYAISPPPTVGEEAAGEYLAAILVDELPEETVKTDRPPTHKITVVPRYAIPVYLMVQGRQQVDVEIPDLTAQKGPALGLLRLDLILHNRGTVHVRPAGTLTIVSPDGSVEFSYPIGRTVPLLPSATLHVPVVVPLPKPGHYRAVTTVEISRGQTVQKEAPVEISLQGEVL